PFGLARRTLAIDDDIAYRGALRQFRLGRPREEELIYETELEPIQAEAQALLTDVSESDPNGERRSHADNLIGVLAFVLAERDPAVASEAIDTGVRSFERAIARDPANADAKFNLEYALNSLVSPVTSRRAGGGAQGRAKGTASAGTEGGDGY
ncbi:MAG: hypothetical protein M3M94_03415, partial [Actinomycetota bacterium]|nr:hypothetical protein [Actinomycetota bacterium]